MPGVFAPVSIAGRILVDGGVVNLVPYDPLQGLTDKTITVNFSSVRSSDEKKAPNALESVLGNFDIMQTATLAETLKNNPPDIYVRPEINGVRMLDFCKVEEVFAQAEPAIEKLKSELGDIA